ncbi:MAG: hypothetical protein SGARI_001939 [Bacillariaceae sp.]
MQFTAMFPGLEDEVEDPSEVNVVSPGFGAAINCMIPLVNVADEPGAEESGDSSYKLSLSGVSSTASPGAGAFPPMTGRVFVATQGIEPFAELYADYGANYFTGRDSYESVPLEQHYELADQLVKRYQKNLARLRRTLGKGGKTKVEATANKGKDDQEDDYIHATPPPTKQSSSSVVNTLQFEHDFWNIMMDTRDIWKESRLLHALPGRNTNTTTLSVLMDFGGTSMQHYNASVKSKEWMEDNGGQCMDQIMDGVSRIPHAGRGAFARRNIQKGGLVSPAPLVHLPNRSALVLYESFVNEEGSWRRNVTQPYSHQLLLNYCFGHAESTALLCPYGLLNFLINHSHGNPNTRIVWSQRHRRPEWLELPIEEWGKNFSNGLSLDFVATRDIEEGEEITIDYGAAWEEAWQSHVHNFDRPRRNYLPAFELNRRLQELEDALGDPTGNDALADLLDLQWQGVTMFCREEYFPDIDWDVRKYKFGFTDEEDYGDFYKCRILFRNDTANSYIAEVLEHESWIENKYTDKEETWEERPELLLLDIPRHAFIYRDDPAQRDHHQFWSFRHDMRIPDDMFPEVWKNLKDTEDETEDGAKEEL